MILVKILNLERRKQLKKERNKRYRERQKLLKLNEVEIGGDVIREHFEGTIGILAKRKVIEHELTKNEKQLRKEKNKRYLER